MTRLKRIATGAVIVFLIGVGLQLAGYQNRPVGWAFVVTGAVLTIAWMIVRHRPAGRVEIRIPRRPNMATEPYIEWLHLEAEPDASSMELESVYLSLYLGSRHFKMMWQSEYGHLETRTLRRGEPAYIPLAIRTSATSESPSGGPFIVNVIVNYIERVGNLLHQWVCYLTDSQFFHGAAEMLPSGAEIDFTVAAFDSHGEIGNESFTLTTPPPGKGSMTIRHAR